MINPIISNLVNFREIIDLRYVIDLYRFQLLDLRCLLLALAVLSKDWFAIPQITARVAGVNEDLQRHDAAKAVQSIPGYVEALSGPPKKGLENTRRAPEKCSRFRNL